MYVLFLECVCVCVAQKEKSVRFICLGWSFTSTSGLRTVCQYWWDCASEWQCFRTTSSYQYGLSCHWSLCRGGIVSWTKRWEKLIEKYHYPCLCLYLGSGRTSGMSFSDPKTPSVSTDRF